MKRSMVVLAFVVGCAGAQMSKKELAPRASFDLGCGVGEQDIQQLDQHAKSFGVTACGCKATYLADLATYTWVLNSVGGDQCQTRTNDRAQATTGTR